VAELVDALDLGPSDFCFESSSLSIRSQVFSIVSLNIINSQDKLTYKSLSPV
jgi:hypothetical protein